MSKTCLLKDVVESSFIDLQEYLRDARVAYDLAHNRYLSKAERAHYANEAHERMLRVNESTQLALITLDELRAKKKAA